MTAWRLLTLNAGSSSLKFAIYARDANLPLLLSGQISGLGGKTQFLARPGGEPVVRELWSDALGMDAVLRRLFGWIEAEGWSQGLDAIGHRVVHGGLEFKAATELTADVVGRLKALSALAPLHQPANLLAVDVAAARFPSALQVGVFDTAFHASQPRIARLYALPRALIAEGVLAYGFHGLSYDYIAGVLREQEGPGAGGRAVVLHLGSGVSLCGLDRGRSVATTMGFSALDGPPMSTRSGSLDPGVILHLMQAKGMSADAIADLLYNRSGLLGLSGVSGDMQTLLSSPAPDAREALEVYVYRIAREIGSLAASLGGLDTLVFTAGVGEHAGTIRQAITDRCGWLGVKLDEEANLAGVRCISAPGSAVRMLVIPTDEQVVTARGVLQLRPS